MDGIVSLIGAGFIVWISCMFNMSYRFFRSKINKYRNPRYGVKPYSIFRIIFKRCYNVEEGYDITYFQTIPLIISTIIFIATIVFPILCAVYGWTIIFVVDESIYTILVSFVYVLTFEFYIGFTGISKKE